MSNRFLSTIRDSHAYVFKLFLFVVSIFIIVFFFPKEGKFKYEFQVGKTWLHQDLVAPFDFAINKSKSEIDNEKNELLNNFKPYFSLDTNVVVNQIKRFEEDFEKKWEEEKPKANKQKTKLFGIETIEFVYEKGIVQVNEILEGKDGKYSINVLKNNQSEEKELSELFTIQSAFNIIQEKINTDNDDVQKNILIDLIENALTHNLFYDKTTSDKILQEQIKTIATTRGMVKRGVPVVSKGEVIDINRFQVLESMREEFMVQLGSQKNYLFILSGQVILIGVCLSLIFLFLMLFRNDIFSDNTNITFILLLIILNVAMTSLALKMDSVSIYILPYCILPVMMRIFFDTRTALFTHLVNCLLLGFIVPNGFEFILIELVGGIITIFSIINMSNRSQLFISVGLIFLSYSITYFGLSIIQQGKTDNLEWVNFGWFAISAMITLFSYPLIYVFEKLFGFVSDITLLELSDTNSPLLRELAEKAPGTFQHSLQVANLAEDTIRSIGGSPLLVRTGALYHDIGKINAPLFFIENQTTGINPHDEISAEESASIITGHVIEGIEKAKKYNLPDRIIDFIRTHHGTSKVQYFYQSYLNIHVGEEIDESMFQYPGPIPFSKETAVLMMADSVEASSRSLKKYDADTIDQLVEKIIDKQIAEGQFVNSDITFKNIHTIKKLFKKKLLNIYHLRLEYPSK